MIWALLLAAVPLDKEGAPLQLYLTLEDVAEHLRSAESLLGKCASSDDETISIQMVLNPDGKVQVTLKESTQVQLAACARDVLEGMRGPVHHGAAVHASTTLYFRGGEAMVSPSPSMRERYVGPLMLFVSGGSEEREAVLRHLNGATEEEG